MILHCSTKYDAIELSKLRAKVDVETENLDRESGEGLLTPEDFEKLIYEDSIAEKTIFLVAEVEGEINTKAIELYKRYGFVEEGLLIKDRIHKYGKYYNTVIMGRLLDK